MLLWFHRWNLYLWRIAGHQSIPIPSINFLYKESTQSPAFPSLFVISYLFHDHQWDRILRSYPDRYLRFFTWTNASCLCSNSGNSDSSRIRDEHCRRRGWFCLNYGVLCRRGILLVCILQGLRCSRVGERLKIRKLGFWASGASISACRCTPSTCTWVEDLKDSMLILLYGSAWEILGSDWGFFVVVWRNWRGSEYECLVEEGQSFCLLWGWLAQIFSF